MTDLSAYMAESIRGIMKSAYLNVLSNPREARFVARLQPAVQIPAIASLPTHTQRPRTRMGTHGRMHTL